MIKVKERWLGVISKYLKCKDMRYEFVYFSAWIWFIAN